MKLLVCFIWLILVVWVSCHGHSHDNDEAPSFKWSKAANTPGDEDLTLEEEGLDLDDIETITGHGHAHVVTEKPQRHGHSHGGGGHGHSHGGGGHGHSHGGHGHSHGQQREPTEEEREKFRKKLHANWDDDEDDAEGNKSSIWFNAMMSTLLISAAPFFILFFIPLDKSEEKQWLLKILLAFASGGLLGDAFLHLIPHAMMAAEGEGDHHGHSHSHGHSHGGEEGHHGPHDMSVGLGVLSGIVAFLCVEKFVRIMKGGHSHSHTIKPAEKPEEKPAKEKKKKAKDSDAEEEENENDKEEEKAAEKKADDTSDDSEEIKVAGFLNLAADMFHNFTDGLAVGASYLAGDSVGLITTITILFHEIPHEIGDFAILIQSGVPRGKAIALQLLTAVGAVTGCALSLLLGRKTPRVSQSLSLSLLQAELQRRPPL